MLAWQVYASFDPMDGVKRSEMHLELRGHSLSFFPPVFSTLQE